MAVHAVSSIATHTRRFLNMLPPTWQTIAASSPTPVQEDCARLTLVRFSSVDAHQLGRQSLQCSWTSSLELSADGPLTAGLVIQPFQTIAESVFIWPVGPKHNVTTLWKYS